MLSKLAALCRKPGVSNWLSPGKCWGSGQDLRVQGQHWVPGQCSGKAEFSLAENSHFMCQEIVLFPFLLLPLLQINTVTRIKKKASNFGFLIALFFSLLVSWFCMGFLVLFFLLGKTAKPWWLRLSLVWSGWHKHLCLFYRFPGDSQSCASSIPALSILPQLCHCSPPEVLQWYKKPFNHLKHKAIILGSNFSVSSLKLFGLVFIFCSFYFKCVNLKLTLPGSFCPQQQLLPVAPFTWHEGL